jgi:hypothetical protein
VNVRKKMPRVIRTSITFEYYPDEDPILDMMGEDATDEDLMAYARETMAEDICQVSFHDVINAIDVEIIND